ncbi:tRNA (adenosine(37)-N6)-dimethylallyltransferase MiaA [Candidatus Daviesbacteria bacterium]|nr:tRNA (adenosine(37)-N6)-dimethylallyltransferase MiaA [Candidatus Daviesbacteria bacterium]
MGKLLVLLGPTATGKTDLGILLAKKFNGELIACDSRQVYKGLDIGTGKMPKSFVKVEKGEGFWAIDGIKIYCYDLVEPKKQYTVAEYIEMATNAIEDILQRDKLPIIVGGSGFYLRALLEGIPSLNIPVDKKIREELGKLSKEQLQSKLKVLDKGRWDRMNKSDRENPRRLLRSIELRLMNPYVNKVQAPNLKIKSYDVLKLGLTAPRENLYKNIDLRVFDWIRLGIILEAQNLYKAGLSLQRMRELGLEYAVLADYLSGKIRTEKKLTELMQFRIHGYLRRQQTWFKKEKNVRWFDITKPHLLSDLEKEIRIWYDQR